MSEVREQEKKVDMELVNVIEDAMSNSKSSTEALDKVIKWEKEHRGLKGFHVSTPLDVLCGVRKVDNPAKEAEDMAHDLLVIHLACAKGELKTVHVSEIDL